MTQILYGCTSFIIYLNLVENIALLTTQLIFRIGCILLLLFNCSNVSISQCSCVVVTYLCSCLHVSYAFFISHILINDDKYIMYCTDLMLVFDSKLIESNRIKSNITMCELLRATYYGKSSKKEIHRRISSNVCY